MCGVEGVGEAFLAFILAVLQPVTELLWKPRVQGSGCCCLEKAACQTLAGAQRLFGCPRMQARDPGLHGALQTEAS